MTTKKKEYETPTACEYQVFVEGPLCSSGAGMMESYGSDPGEDDSIF